MVVAQRGPSPELSALAIVDAVKPTAAALSRSMHEVHARASRLELVVTSITSGSRLMAAISRGVQA
jgi:hypothetical protein